jgi:hypothetical protein
VPADLSEPRPHLLRRRIEGCAVVGHEARLVDQVVAGEGGGALLCGRTRARTQSVQHGPSAEGRDCGSPDELARLRYPRVHGFLFGDDRFLLDRPTALAGPEGRRAVSHVSWQTAVLGKVGAYSI